MLNVIDTTQENNAPRSKVDARVQDRLRVWLEDRITASKKKPIAEVVTLVPALAALLLERNPVNRPISKANAGELLQDIASDRFIFNGESIVISNTGVLLDGQHRCLIVAESGTPIETVIVFGPKEEARFTIDTGRTKTVANFLAMKGRHYNNVLGTVAGFVIQWKEYGFITTSPAINKRPSKQQILASVDELKGLDDSVAFTYPTLKSVRSHAVLAFCHYAFWKKTTRELADDFLLKLMEGDGLRKGDPILYCRNKLIGMGRNIDATSRAELVFKCWNASRTGGVIAAFRTTGGKLPKIER